MRFVFTAAEQNRRDLASLNQKPPAQIQPGETEQQMDIRLFKERYGEGKRAFEGCASLMARIYERGEWKQNGLAWGSWSEKHLGVSKTHAYSIVAVKNSATEELIRHYNGQVVIPITPEKRVDIPALPKREAKVVKLPEPETKSIIESAKMNGHERPIQVAEVQSKRMVCFLCHGSGWVGSKPEDVKDPCKCGCGLTAKMSEFLWRHGVPCDGLEMKQAGLIISKIIKNEGKLPESFAWAKNKGDWKIRRLIGRQTK